MSVLPLQDFLRKHVTTSLHGIAECSERLAVMLYGTGLAAVDALFDAQDIDLAEADRWRTELRETLDRHHPDGYAQYLELLKTWPELEPTP